MPSNLHEFRVRLTDEQVEAVRSGAELHGFKSDAEYVRAVLAGDAPPPERFRNEVQQRGKYTRKTQQ